MTISPKSVRFDEGTMWVSLEDGQIFPVALAQFPVLLNATQQQREKYEISAYGLHWEDLDEDIAIEGLLMGKQVVKPAISPVDSTLSAR
ncbi:DUF2442 domain-containing protein [Rahnella selenatireducens]|uniref:DUF2442 domain-containing protein n=1 Tax=Rahnella selenatireducens TaxID=3389797 RepID=UPI003968FFEA